MKGNRQNDAEAAVPSRRLSWVGEAVPLILLLVLGSLVYANTLSAPFVLDDSQNIVENRHIRISSLELGSLSEAAFESYASRRPVANISFALNYLLGGYGVTGYHVVNIAVHLACGLLLYFFFRTTLGLPSLRDRYPGRQWVPLLAALLWLLHPLQIQAVTYVVQRMTSMAAMFYLLSLLLYVKARMSDRKVARVFLFGGCLLSGLLSLGSKEIGATLPFFILLYDRYFLGMRVRVSASGRRLHLFFCLLLLCALIFFYLGNRPWQALQSVYQYRDFSLLERLLTEGRVVIFYLSLLLFPLPGRLNLDHDFPLSFSMFEPVATLLALLALAFLLILAFGRARKAPLLSFALFWFFGNMVIESSFIGLELVFEHRLYLPSAMLFLVAVLFARQCIGNAWLRKGIAVGVVLLLAFWTVERNRTWADPVRLWQDSVSKSPRKARSRNNLGIALEAAGMFDAASEQFAGAVALEPEFWMARSNRGKVLTDLGEYDEAIVQLQEAIKLNPGYAKAHYNLGNVLVKKWQLQEAVVEFAEAARLDPGFLDAYFNLGVALTSLRRNREAMAAYRMVLQLDPDHAVARLRLNSLR